MDLGGAYAQRRTQRGAKPSACRERAATEGRFDFSGQRKILKDISDVGDPIFKGSGLTLTTAEILKRCDEKFAMILATPWKNQQKILKNDISDQGDPIFTGSGLTPTAAEIFNISLQETINRKA